MPNRTTKTAPFVTVNGKLPQQPMDIIKVNAKYKEKADKGGGEVNFAEGDFVMVHLRTDFLLGLRSYSKLKNKKFGLAHVRF